MELRQIVVQCQEVRSEGGRTPATPTLRAAACAVLRNPYAGGAPLDDFTPLVERSVEVGELLTQRALALLAGQPVRGYGQSWPTLIFLPYDSLLDSTTRHFLGLQDTAEGAEFYNVVAVHEMAHQWWGHMVGWKTYHDQWLSEGIAEVSAALYLQIVEPKKWNSGSCTAASRSHAALAASQWRGARPTRR